MATPLQNLTAVDRELLDLAIERDLNLHSLINRTAPHSSRHSLLSLLEWFAQPHIKAAATFLVSSYAFVDDLAQDLIRKDLREGLKQVFAQTLTFNNLIEPTPENADRANRALRESRLVASTLKRLNTNPRQKSKAAPNEPGNDSLQTPHHIAPLAAPSSTHTASTESTDLLATPLNLDLSSRFTRTHSSGISPARRLTTAAGAAPPRTPPRSLRNFKPLTFDCT